MSTFKKSIYYHAANHGLMIGIIMIIYSVIIYIFDLVTISLFSGAVIGLVNLIIYFVLILILTKNFRNKANGGYITYGKALYYGILIGFFSSLIVAFYNLIFNLLIDPEYQKHIMEKISTMTEEYMLNAGLSEEMVEQQIKAMQAREMPDPYTASIMAVPGTVIMSFIVSLITSIFVKKKGDAFTSTMNELDNNN